MHLPDIVTPYPLSFILVCIIIGIAVAMLLYFREKRSEIPTAWRWVGAALRAFVYSLVAFLILQPLIQSFVKEREKPIIAVMVDNSISMTMSQNASEDWMDKLHTAMDELGTGYDIRYYRFDQRVEENDTVNFMGYRTDIGNALFYIDNIFRSRNLGAVVLASDGIVNTGMDPLQTVEALNAPIYSIALGDTTQYSDVSLANVESNRVAFLGNTFPIRVHIRAQRAEGENIRLQVFRDGVMLHSEMIRVVGEDFYGMKELRFDADRPGLNKYVVTLSPLEKELNTANNRQSVYVEVLDSRHKVLILASAPHPDITALRQSFESKQQVEVDVVMLPASNLNPEAYDMVVLYQIPNSKYDGRALIGSLRERAIPTLFILGGQSDTQVFDALNLGVRVAGGQNKFNDVDVNINPRFSLFRTQQRTADLLGNMDPLLVPFGEFEAAPGTQSLLFQRIGKVSTEKPLFAFHDLMGWRTAYLLGEGIWRWRLGMFKASGSHEWFNDFLASTIQYLAVAEKKGRFRVELPNSIVQSDPVEVRAELYNAAFQPEPNKEIQFELRDSAGTRFDYTFSDDGEAYSLSLGYLPAGKYSYRALAKDVTGISPITGVFEVEEVNVESSVLQANHRLLGSLSALRDGEMIYPERISDITKIIEDREDIRPLVFTHKRYTDLVRWPYYLIALLLLLTVEWVIRRASGAY